MTAAPPSPPTPDRIAEIASDLTERDALRALLRRAWSELNAIRAETGVPLGYDGMRRCTIEHWNDLVEDCRAALGDDALPWETPAAKTLTDRAEKLAEDRSADLLAALGEVTRTQAAEIARLLTALAAKDAEVERLTGERDEQKAGWTGCFQVAIGWQDKAGELEATIARLTAEAAAVREPSDEAMERAMKAFEAARNRKVDDIFSVSPTERPDDGGGPLGYGIRAAVRALGAGGQHG